MEPAIMQHQIEENEEEEEHNNLLEPSAYKQISKSWSFPNSHPTLFRRELIKDRENESTNHATNSTLRPVKKIKFFLAFLFICSGFLYIYVLPS